MSRCSCRWMETPRCNHGCANLTANNTVNPFQVELMEVVKASLRPPPPPSPSSESEGESCVGGRVTSTDQTQLLRQFDAAQRACVAQQVQGAASPKPRAGFVYFYCALMTGREVGLTLTVDYRKSWPPCAACCRIRNTRLRCGVRSLI